MNIPHSTPILLRKMEQLYQIKFDNTVFICLSNTSNNNNEYNVLTAEQVREKALDEVMLEELKFDSITEVLSQTRTGKFSESNPINRINSLGSLTPVLGFKTSDKHLYIDIQNVLFREMIDYAEAMILADEELSIWLEENGNFNKHILFMGGFG